MAYKYNPIPAPQVIDGERWLVRDSGEPTTAFVDFENKVMVVPMDGTETGDMIRAHETIHVGITPRDPNVWMPAGLENRTIQSIEDCRVYSFAKKAGIPTKASHWSADDIKKTSLAHTREQTRCIMAVRGTGDEKPMRRAMSNEANELADRLVDKYFKPAEDRNSYPSFDDVLSCCKELEEATPGQGGINQTSTIYVPFMKPGESEQNTDSKDYSSPQELDEMEEILGRRFRTRFEMNVRNAGPACSNMEVATPPLPRRLRPGKSYGLKKVPTDVGSVPYRMERFCVDKAVFSTKVRKGFGTVLIDFSGSMPLTTYDIEQIINALPMAHIAIYSGHNGGEKGRLHILARDGRRVDRIPDCKGWKENVVDTEAIKWLARQRAPRIWISDGFVTGLHYNTLNTEAALELTRNCISAGIKRYNSLHDFLAKKTDSSLNKKWYGS